MTTPKQPTLAMRMAIHSDAQRPFRELAKEFRRLAAEATKRAEDSYNTFWMAEEEAAKTWNQAAQMLEEKLY